MLAIASKQEFWSLNSPQNVECKIMFSVKFTMQPDDGFEKVFIAVLAVETIITKICQIVQKKGDRGG